MYIEIIDQDGKAITLTQSPYITCDPSAPEVCWYQASGIDADGLELLVIWEIVNEMAEEEEEACDWEIFKTELIGK